MLGGRGGGGDGQGRRKGTHDRENIVDPAVPDPESDKTEDEGRDGDAQGDHDGPDAHVPGPLALEEGLGDHPRPDGRSRTDEESGDGTAEAHGCVGVTIRAPDVADETADQGDQEDRPPAKALRQRSPEQRRDAQDGNHQGREVACGLYFNVEIHRDVHEGCHDGGSGEGPHHGVKGDEDQVDDFLPALIAC